MDLKLVYGISRWTNPHRASARHIDNGKGKPLCGGNGRKAFTWQTDEGEPSCKKCISKHKKLKCEHEGCQSINTIDCEVEDFDTGEKHQFKYCAEHCQEEGFCYCCGGFFGGIEEFDFNNPSGLCGYCKDQIDAELCSDDHFDHQDYDGFDEPEPPDEYKAEYDMWEGVP